MTSDMFFAGWLPILRILVAGSLAYVALVLILRVSGKRTLSKLNAFDLVVTVAIGSTFAAVITNRSLPLSEGVAALFLLVALQFAVTAVSVRVPWAGRLIKAEPTLLLHEGRVLHDAARRERVVEAEILAAIRASGGADFDDAVCVVLEADGGLSAVLKPR